MDIQDFLTKVTEMRTFQKRWFRYRDPDALRKAKKSEKEVDSEIERLTGTAPGETVEISHPKLF